MNPYNHNYNNYEDFLDEQDYVTEQVHYRHGQRQHLRTIAALEQQALDLEDALLADNPQLVEQLRQLNAAEHNARMSGFAEGMGSGEARSSGGLFPGLG